MTNTAAILIPTGEPEIVPARVRDSPMAPGEPEKRLMLAVLERAVDEFRTYGMVPTGRGRRLCRDVAGWFGFLGYRRVRFRRHLVRRPDSIPPSSIHQKGSAELVRRATSAPASKTVDRPASAAVPSRPLRRAVAPLVRRLA